MVAKDVSLTLSAETEFSARLRMAMEGRAIQRVARRAGVARATLQRWLGHHQAGRCKRGPYLDTIEALAEELGVRPAWLAWGDGEMHQADPAGRQAGTPLRAIAGEGDSRGA